MKIDYNNFEFTKDEKKYMFKETERLQETNPNHIPVLIQLDSNILKMDKQKFLISDDIKLSDFINNTLKKKLINLYNNDVIVINIVSDKLIELKSQSILMKDIYKQYKDIETNLLILRVSRNTTFKWVKGCAEYFFGY